MFGSDVDSIRVNLEYFQSGEIFSVPLLHLTSKQNSGENETNNEHSNGPEWEKAQLCFQIDVY